jgi:hypothetical protein
MTVRSRILAASAGLAVAAALAVQALAQEARAPVMSHELEGRDQCLMCHSGMMAEMPAVPETHEGRGNETCLWCHGTDSAMQTLQPKAIPHELEGRTECLMCHSGMMADMPAAPADHEGRENKHCQMCHKRSAG